MNEFLYADWLGLFALGVLSVFFAVVVRKLMGGMTENEEPDREVRQQRRRDAIRRAREEEQQHRDERIVEKELRNLEKEEEQLLKLQEKLKAVKAEYKHWADQMRCIPVEKTPETHPPSDCDVIDFVRSVRVSSVGQVAKKFRVSVKFVVEKLKSLRETGVFPTFVDKTGLIVAFVENDMRSLVKLHPDRDSLAKALAARFS